MGIPAREFWAMTPTEFLSACKMKAKANGADVDARPMTPDELHDMLREK